MFDYLPTSEEEYNAMRDERLQDNRPTTEDYLMALGSQCRSCGRYFIDIHEDHDTARCARRYAPETLTLETKLRLGEEDAANDLTEATEAYTDAILSALGDEAHPQRGIFFTRVAQQRIKLRAQYLENRRTIQFLIDDVYGAMSAYGISYRDEADDWLDSLSVENASLEGKLRDMLFDPGDWRKAQEEYEHWQGRPSDPIPF